MRREPPSMRERWDGSRLAFWALGAFAAAAVAGFVLALVLKLIGVLP